MSGDGGEAGEGGARGSGYRVLLELTRGGMGRVLLARRRGAHGFERLVAIKTMRAELRERDEMRAMFLDEARLMARLHHPAIAQVHDLIELDGELCLVMEYVPGVSFSRLTAMRPPPLVSVEAMTAVLRGLHAAHELCDEAGEPLGVVHRDVSPQNLMIDFDGRVKVLDFGIAWMRRRQTAVTELGTLKGKPAYMSPEQLASQAVDRRADVYAAAVVLHELLTGARLFVGESVLQLAHAMMSGSIEPPSATAGPLPAGLDEVVMRGLARDPDRRFASAQEMADVLEEVTAAGRGERLDAFARRELASEREQHDARLRAAEIDGGAANVPEGRPTGVGTAVGDEAPEPNPAGADTQLTREEADDGGQETVPVIAGQRRSRGLLAIASSGALALVVGGWLALRDAPASAPASATESAPGSGSVSASASAPVSASEPAPASAPASASASASAPAPAAARTARAVASAAVAPGPSATVAAAVGAPSAQVTEYGMLTVGADPYALVQLDGASIGPTPILNRKVPVGTHRVVLVSPDNGAVRVERTVEIVAGATAQVIAR